MKEERYVDLLRELLDNINDDEYNLKCCYIWDLIYGEDIGYEIGSEDGECYCEFNSLPHFCNMIDCVK